MHSRHFFHLTDGKHLPDPDGIDLPDLKSAHAYAADILIGQIREDVAFDLAPQHWTLDVADENGRTIFTLKFSSFQPNR